MTVAELRIALADLPGNATVDLVHSNKPNTTLVEYEPVILLNRQEGYVIITTETDLAAVIEEYGFIPRRKYNDR